MDWDDLKRRWRVWSGDFRGMDPTADFDRAQWFDAAMQREQPKIWNREKVRTFLKARNMVRWNRLQRDIKYFEKQLRRAQVYEDVRWYL